MRISISYPPLKSNKGTPTLSQNRQFQWFSAPTYIYPVIPAYLATMLKNEGHEVLWDDAVAQELNYNQWLARLNKFQPDMIVMETKTPVIKKHWEIINALKSLSSYKVKKFKIILVGDHVTALPEESFKKSEVDYVIAGGDYDFAVMNLANFLSGWEELKGGVWHRNEKGEIKNTGSMNLAENNLNKLPVIDRELTRWKDYAYKNGNFKNTPGAYLMSGRDCWWGQCSFCSWTTLFPGNKFRVMPPAKVLDEIGNLIKLGAKEIMEDSGTLPVGEWLENFCRGMIERGYNKKIKIDCNMRINGVKNPAVYKLMKQAGFRLILFGLESANQETLDKINKNLKTEEIEPALKMCKEAGLEPHVTAMIGYPWENKKMAENTINLAKKLFKKGCVDTLQATLVIPYPGTPLYKDCKENNLLLTEDYDRYDQREPIMKAPLSNDDAKELIRDLYKAFFSPQFIWKKIKSIRNWEDIKFLWKAGWKWLGHWTDFSEEK